MDDKETRFAVKFLRACNNFNTNRENARLLMYGFIDNKKNKKIYNEITKDIIKKLISFVNITTNCDKWSSDFNISTNGHTILANQASNISLSDSARTLNVIKYGYGECFAIHRLFETAIRKLWKIQIKIEKDIEEKLDFGVGIDNYTNRYHLFLSNYDKTKPRIKNNDIIYILFYQYGIDQNILKFAVNGKEFGPKYKDIRVSSQQGRGGRVVVTFYQNMKFVMLPQE